jgi:membrane-bound lytic murein transglycosylase A
VSIGARWRVARLYSLVLRVAAFRQYLRKCSWADVPADVPQTPLAGLTPYQVIAADGGENGLFTGYFEPLLKGSFTKTARFKYPVYGPPADLSIVPNFEGSGQNGQWAYGRIKASWQFSAHVTRSEVMHGALDNKQLEILYVDDAVDLFFAHVQGSAAISMDDGSIQRIGFAAKSGQPYVAIGQTLKDMGALQPPIAMDSIKAWLRAHPQQQEQVLCSNPSFIFFRLLQTDGPIGAAGDVLIPQESLAVDDTIWPYGLKVIVATHDPLDTTKPFIRLMRTADTGSAIKGVIRGDIYFGSGDAAGHQAGAMNAAGKLWVLLSD